MCEIIDFKQVQDLDAEIAKLSYNDDDTSLVLVELPKHGWVASVTNDPCISTKETKEFIQISCDEHDKIDGVDSVIRFHTEQECREYYTECYKGLFSRIIILL